MIVSSSKARPLRQIAVRKWPRSSSIYRTFCIFMIGNTRDSAGTICTRKAHSLFLVVTRSLPTSSVAGGVM